MSLEKKEFVVTVVIETIYQRRVEAYDKDGAERQTEERLEDPRTVVAWAGLGTVLTDTAFIYRVDEAGEGRYR